eukprot:6184366-Pleurochrysis_carterae.AAC.1
MAVSPESQMVLTIQNSTFVGLPNASLPNQTSISQRRLQDKSTSTDDAASTDFDTLTAPALPPALPTTSLTAITVAPVTAHVVAAAAAAAANAAAADAAAIPDRRLLFISGGRVTARFVTFSDNRNGGAVEVTGGTLTMQDCRIQRNVAQRGAAILVEGGSVVADTCLIEDNVATEAGGGLFVRKGSVHLSNLSVLLNNEANSGRAISLDASGTISYTLPAPLGRRDPGARKL